MNITCNKYEYHIYCMLYQTSVFDQMINNRLSNHLLLDRTMYMYLEQKKVDFALENTFLYMY